EDGGGERGDCCESVEPAQHVGPFFSRGLCDLVVGKGRRRARPAASRGKGGLGDSLPVELSRGGLDLVGVVRAGGGGVVRAGQGELVAVLLTGGPLGTRARGQVDARSGAGGRGG